MRESMLGEARDSSRPYLALNMIVTVDGRAAIGGTAVGIGSERDKRLMREMRAEADVILHGAATVRADPLSARVPADLSRQRVQRGLSPQPLGAIVTASGNLPAEHPYYASATRIYVTTDARIDVHGDNVEVRRVRTVAQVMADLHRDGYRRIVCEGGPTLNAVLFEAQLVDELFVTVAPKLAGGSQPL
ncbi:MAG: dihydrofolate reductase family protein, partial [Chloroflexi bacterium]|nr:dihydrofolate reductase family protein [Chloroflexota bacterium]